MGRAALFGLGLLAATGCATADGGGAYRSEASEGAPAAASPAPTARPTSPAPTARPTSPAPAARPTSTAPAAATRPSAVRVTVVGEWPSDVPPPQPPPAPPPGVAPNDPRIDEALAGLDAKIPSGCRKYANAFCRTETVPDYGRLETCAGVVANINRIVKQIRESTSAVPTCDAMANSAPPK